MQELNKHLHEKLKWLSRLSAARVRHHWEAASYSLSKSGAICWLQNKERNREGALSGQWFIHGTKKILPPLNWYLFCVLTLPSFSGLGIYVSLLHVFFSVFHYYMTNHSPQSTVPRSQQGCPRSENYAAPQAFPTSGTGCEQSSGEQWHLQLAMSTVRTQMTFLKQAERYVDDQVVQEIVCF